jgi:propanol-preferring alcohol dehydrogenase
MGERVGVPWLYSACGHCEAQTHGLVATSRTAALPSTSLLTPNHVAHIPARLSAVDAALLICAGITSCKGIKETQAMPGEWIVISRIGGLDHLGVQYAKARGLHMCAVVIGFSAC